MQRISVEIEGISPLLMHSAAGVNPTDPRVVKIKELTAKGTKKRTSFDDAEIDRLSFELALYANGKGPYIPGMNVHACIREGSKAMRLGKQILSGVDVEEEELPLIYDGPRTMDKLYEKGFVDRRVVVVNRSRVIRVRPRFDQWGLKFTLRIDPKVINEDRVNKSLQNAGLNVGLGDFRPRFGRFEVKSWEVL